jgi:hypothetical protein
MTSPRELAQSVYAAADALNEVVTAAVQAGLQVDLSVMETTDLPKGRLPMVRAGVSNPIPREP